MANQPHFRRWLLFFCLLAAGVYLAGNSRFALIDRDEGWYAQISRQMVESGDWVVPRFMAHVFEGKPVFAFWCQAASMTLFGQTPFAARLPSALAAVLILWIIGLCVRRIGGEARALWTVGILSSATLFLALSKMALTDLPLLLWITLAEVCLYRMYRRRAGVWVAIAFWAFVGLSILTKGPVVIGVLGATVGALWLLDVGSQWRSPRAWLDAARWWLGCHPWLGLPIVAAIVAPWVVLVQQRAPGFLGQTLQDNMFGPIFRAPLEGHRGFPGYYSVMVWVAWMPWSLILAPTMMRAWGNRRIKTIRFALAAVIGPWIVIELVKQKLPHYLLPMYPAMAFLTADYVLRCLRGQYADLRRWVGKAGIIIWAVGVTGVSLAPFALAWPGLRFGPLPWVGMTVLAICGVGTSVIAWALFRRENVRFALASVGVGTAVWGVVLFGMLFPRFEFLRLTPRIAGYLADVGATDQGDIGMIDHRKLGYNDPSLAFYLDGNYTSLGDGSCLIERPEANWPRYIIATKGTYEQLPDALRGSLKPLTTVRGFALGSGRIVDVMIFRRDGAGG